MKLKFALFGMLIGLLTVGCSSDSEGEDNNNNSNNEPPVEIALSRSQQDIVDSQGRLAFDFFRQTSEWAATNVNLVISPLSLSIELAMLANGAGEKTYNDIVSAAYLPNTTVEELNELYGKLVGEMISADHNVEFSMTNGIWTHKSLSLNDRFVNNVKNYYTADIQSIDFHDRIGSLNTFNRWVSEKTKGSISEVFNEYANFRSTELIVCTALSFNGKWTVPFDKKYTRSENFTNIGDHNTKVDMMIAEAVSNTYSYVLTEIAEIIRLPYGNRTFSMYVILPNIKDENYEKTYNRFIENLDYDWWVESKNQMTYDNKPITVHLPKFNLPTLYGIGITPKDKFKDIILEPDMSLMTDANFNRVYIEQCNTIEVTESGTITASENKGELTNSPLATFVNVNRPFIFLIEEGSTGAILFMGKVTKL